MRLTVIMFGLTVLDVSITEDDPEDEAETPAFGFGTPATLEVAPAYVEPHTGEWE